MQITQRQRTAHEAHIARLANWAALATRRTASVAPEPPVAAETSIDPDPIPVAIDPALLWVYFSAHVAEPEVMPIFGPPRITGRQILDEVVEKHGITIVEIRSLRRDKAVSAAKREAVYRMKTETLLSYPQMGLLLNRDHTTMLYHYRKQCELLERGEVV